MTDKAELGRVAPAYTGRAALALLALVGHGTGCGSDGARSRATDAEVQLPSEADAGSDEQGEDDAAVDGAEPDTASPAEPRWGDVVLEDAVSISGDPTGVCYVDSAGKVLCRGLNDHGQLGNGARGGVNGAPLSTNRDAEVLGIDDARDVLAVSSNARCALAESGTILCWGLVGDTLHVAPVALALPDGVGEARAMRGVYRGAVVTTLAVLTSADQLCALTAAGAFQCAPVVAGAQTFAAIPHALYVLDADGHVSTCTLPSEGASCTPLALPAPALDVLAFEDDLPMGIALLDDGRVACWGACPLDDPSDLTFVPESAPELLPGLDAVARLVSPACTADRDDTLRCWGKPVRSGDLNFYTRPERIGVLPGLARLVGTDADGLPNLALTTDGQVRSIVWR